MYSKNALGTIINFSKLSYEEVSYVGAYVFLVKPIIYEVGWICVYHMSIHMHHGEYIRLILLSKDAPFTLWKYTKVWLTM